MSERQLRRLAEAETAVAHQHHARHRLDHLAMVPAHELTDAQAVERWRELCRQPAPAQRPQPYSPDEQAALLAAWRELRA